jgi:hypothetical protein
MTATCCLLGLKYHRRSHEAKPLMILAQTLGLGVQFVPDPEARMQRRIDEMFYG